MRLNCEGVFPNSSDVFGDRVRYVFFSGATLFLVAETLLVRNTTMILSTMTFSFLYTYNFALLYREFAPYSSDFDSSQ